MSSNFDKKVGLRLTPEAKSAVREYVNLLADAITMQSKSIASVAESEQVHLNHVRKVYESVLTSSARRQKLRQVFNGVGTLTLGAACSQFYSEYLNISPRPAVFAFCFGSAMLGLILWLVSIFKE